jgi:tRNA U34 5-methylaminomethyl-2-thiouridine-forming methyltransferase MnmC
MNLELFRTGDGSLTLRWIAQDECYHSRHGAIQESKYVYINAGLQFLINSCSPRSIKIFEVGFGTGLNALLTYSAAQPTDIAIDYHTVEPFPLADSIWRNLTYPQDLGDERLADVFATLHSADDQGVITVGDNFKLTKHRVSLEHYSPTTHFDLIYYDAFGPRVQPELWSEEVLTKVSAMLNTQGVLVTYCAKGAVKRAFRKSGLLVESLPGPPGKREMIRVSKV